MARKGALILLVAGIFVEFLIKTCFIDPKNKMGGQGRSTVFLSSTHGPILSTSTIS
jgi:hypothetical protein